MFTYEQNSCSTSISILSAQTIFSYSDGFRTTRGNITARHVSFNFCGLEFNDSFEALSKALTLVKVFEKRQCGKGAGQFAMTFPTVENPSLRLFCQSVKNTQSYDEMRIGWITQRNGKEHEKAHVMNIGYVHDFRNALHKAMGWISPEAHTEFMRLD